MSTTLRRALLRGLQTIGLRNFVATSGLGHPFVCHLGDFFGEYPYYTRHAFAPELEICAAWLADESNPVVLDVGANVGFWSTQLAQMLGSSLRIYAFEPVPATFCKLICSVEQLTLEARVFPVCAAMSDRSQLVQLSVNPRVSGYAQVSEGQLNARVGDRIATAAATSVDEFVTALGIRPALLKVDVEGSEIRVLRGARSLIGSLSRPALLFEFNPLTLAEVGASPRSFVELLTGYVLHYVDDFEGHRRAFGSSVADLDEIGWTCNLFAIPATDEARARFSRASKSAQDRLRRHG